MGYIISSVLRGELWFIVQPVGSSVDEVGPSEVPLQRRSSTQAASLLQILLLQQISTGNIFKQLFCRNPKMSKVVEKRRKKSGFLEKTYNILQNQEYQHIISWNENGAGFIIHNCEDFTQKVLPKHFRHENFNSFVRQLNMYGFTKKRAPRSQNYYCHEKFEKNARSAISEIRRRTEKKSGSKKERKKERASSELSIELESRNQNLHSKDRDRQHERIYLNLYSLMNANQHILSSQSLAIQEISRDLQFLGLEDNLQASKLIGRPGNVLQIFEDYMASNSSFNAHLLHKIKIQMKGSQKNIRSITAVQTEANLNHENKAFGAFKVR